MSESLIKFLLHYPISIIFLPLGEDENKVGNFIKENIGVSSVILTNSIPDQNESDILIIICKNSNTFQELQHQNFIKRKYNKFPTKIIIILSVCNLLIMDHPLQYLTVLSKYKIPILFCNIYNSNVNINIVTVRDCLLDESIIKIYENGEGCKIENIVDIVETIRSIIEECKSNNIIIRYCDKDTQMIKEFIDNKNEVFSLYNSILNSSGKVLDFISGELIVL